MTIIEKRITVGTLYKPKHDNQHIFIKIFKEIYNIENENAIPVGDWYIMIDPDLDYLRQRKMIKRSSRMFIFNKIRDCNLVDVWQAQNDAIRQYTWHKKF